MINPRAARDLPSTPPSPPKIGELAAAIAALLEFHKTTLDLTDENARKEHDAYSELAMAFRETATQLHATAKQMTGYCDLPMGRHDFAALGSPAAVAVFATLREARTGARGSAGTSARAR